MKLSRRFVFGLLVSVLAVMLVVLGGCKRKETATGGGDVSFPVITDAMTDLHLTWIDDKGEFHVETSVAKVPESAREVVRVNDPVKDPPTIDDVFVADLRTAGPAGAYPVKTMPRPAFEKIAVERRQQQGKTVLSPQAAASVLPAATAPTVIIYGASWCGPCHQAAAYLKRKGVPFVEKDIEADSSAAREMHAKLASAGMHGGSIPVIDVRGKVIVGFDERAVERALAL